MDLNNNKIVLLPADTKITIKEWQIIKDGDIEFLIGKVYGHPVQFNGTKISTSEIVKMEGKIAWVASGKKYFLE